MDSINQLSRLNKDELFSIAINLPLNDLIRFCETNKNINNKICKRTDIWYYRLKKDFPEDYSLE